MASTIKGPAVFLAQFAGDEHPFNSLPSIAAWAAGHGYIGIQVPSWDGRLFDLEKAAESQDYCDEVKGICAEAGVVITELSTHLQGQLLGLGREAGGVVAGLVADRDFDRDRVLSERPALRDQLGHRHVGVLPRGATLAHAWQITEKPLAAARQRERIRNKIMGHGVMPGLNVLQVALEQFP